MVDESGAIHLELLGLVSWHVSGVRTPVVSGRSAEIAVILAMHRPGWVSVDALMEELWDEPPHSRSNALQRHVSRLRRQIGEICDVDPNDVVEWSPAGYRLGEVASSDFDTVSSPYQPDLTLLRWEPELGGVDADRLMLLRSALATRVADHRRRWVHERIDSGKPKEAFDALVEALPGRTDDVLAAELLLDIAEAIDEPAVRSVIAERALEIVNPVVMPAAISSRLRRLTASGREANSPAFQYTSLHGVAMSALTEGFTAALDRVDDIDAVIPDDVRRRLVRSLVWSPEGDGFVRVLLSELAGLPASMQPIAECVLVSLDAWAVERMPDSVGIADDDVCAAATTDELVRALRVRFMVGLGWPSGQAELEVVARLAEIDHPDAIVESARFEALLAVKACDPADALVRLDRHRLAAARHWPESIDELDVLVRLVMRSRWPDLVHQPDRGLLPIESNHGTLVVVRMVELAFADEPLSAEELGEADRLCESLRRTHSLEVAQAFELLTAVTACRSEAAEAVTITMVDTWLTSPPNRHRHIGLLALGRHAEATGDVSLATSVVNALEPWRNEMLGIWPIDALLGPAAEWIDRFRVV